MSSPRIYLAGPDVFYSDAQSHFARLKQKLAAAGLHGVSPADDEFDGAPCAQERAQSIFQRNVELIRGCDALLVNLECWRGTEPDAGTVWELGFAHGLGKPTVAYMSDSRTYCQRVRDTYPTREDGGLTVDRDGRLVEDLGQPVNLMLALCGPLVTTGLDDAVRTLQRVMRTVP